MRDIILGRTKSDLKKLGKKGIVFIGKQYVQMGQSFSLSNRIYLDVSRAHAILICGKRGGGKSYTLGAIAEGLADLDESIAKNLCFVMFDTMGIYWTMKFPNSKDENLLKSWGLEPKGLDVNVYVPGDFYNKLLEDGIPVDYPFYLKPSDLSLEDWLNTFKLDIDDPVGVALQRAIGRVSSKDNFSIDDIIKEVENDDRISETVRLALVTRLENCKQWGIFSEKAKPIRELLIPGKISVVDLSIYASMPGGWEIKALVMGLISKKIFLERLIVRKREELKEINSKIAVSEDYNVKDDLPMPWIIIDEAHEFLPEDIETPASAALRTILREGRQPGVSLILATQQPARIHMDAITQSDIVISHRITASFDLDSLDKIFLSYEIKGSKYLFNSMPRKKGCAIIMDDKNERLYTIQIKPRVSWHGGEDPCAVNSVESNDDLFF